MHPTHPVSQLALQAVIAQSLEQADEQLVPQLLLVHVDPHVPTLQLLRHPSLHDIPHSVKHPSEQLISHALPHSSMHPVPHCTVHLPPQELSQEPKPHPLEQSPLQPLWTQVVPQVVSHFVLQ